jgi:hypothetical protein
MSEQPQSGTAAADRRAALLRERLGTSSLARRRREAYDGFVRDRAEPQNTDEFTASFRDLADRLPAAGDVTVGDLLDPHPPVFVGTGQHVFGPGEYEFGVGEADSFGIGQATADRTTGEVHAREFVTANGDALAFAIVGVNYRPAVNCKLSVRPYLRWDGWDALQHHDAMPSLHQQAWCTVLGQVGIYIISSTPDGHLWHEDVSYWQNVWYRSEGNPSGTRSYDGVESSSTGLRVDGVLADKDRLYEIQVGVRAYASVAPTFAVTAGATAEIAATVPFFVVEEVRH